MVVGIALLLLQSRLHVGDSRRDLVHAVGILVHQVPQDAHTLIEGLLHLRELRLKVLHLRLQFDDVAVDGPCGSRAHKASGDNTKNYGTAKDFHVSSWFREHKMRKYGFW